MSQNSTKFLIAKKASCIHKEYFLNQQQLYFYNYITLQFLNPRNMGSTHHHYHYETSPQVLKELAQLRSQLNDPQKAPANIKRMKELIFADLAKHQFPKSLNGKKIVFIGHTSVGKSSLLNTLFGTKLPTSKGPCTKKVQSIGTISGVQIFDCPGYDTHFQITQKPELIPIYLGTMDEIYYLYDGEPQEDIVRICLAMKKNIIAVRTKCDPEESPEENPQLKVQDYKRFSNLGVKNPIVFFTSKKGSEDNAKLVKHMLK